MMERAQAIKPGETCVIIAPFEPIPLYDVLRAQGFPYETQQVVHNEWVIQCAVKPLHSMHGDIRHDVRK